MSEQVIEILEEEHPDNKSQFDTLVVRGEQVLDTIKSLVSDVTVRRIVVKRRDGQKILDIPLVAGLAGTVLFWMWMPIPLITALAFECSIIVERRPRGLNQGYKPAALQPAPVVEVEENEEEEVMLAAATPDDLTRINGIGPKVASLLNENGLTTFAQLAQTDVGQLKTILEQAGSRYRLLDPTTWPEQARKFSEP